MKKPELDRIVANCAQYKIGCDPDYNDGNKCHICMIKGMALCDTFEADKANAFILEHKHTYGRKAYDNCTR